MQIRVIGSSFPTIVQVQALLGKEDEMYNEHFVLFDQEGKPQDIITSHEKKGTVDAKPVTWHQFGWLGFGCVEGKVYVVAGDCPHEPETNESEETSEPPRSP